MSVARAEPPSPSHPKARTGCSRQMLTRTARDLREHAARWGCSIEDLVVMVLADYALKLRRERRLEAIDAEIAS